MPLPFGYRVRTLHGLAHDIVREKPAAAGLEDRFSIIDENDANVLRREAAISWLHGNPSAMDEYILPDLEEYKRDQIRRKDLPELVKDLSYAFIRSAKDDRLAPEKVKKLLDDAPAPLPLANMCAEIYSDYQKGLTYRGAVDFDDLIRLAIDLLDNDPEFLERLRYRWPYILEDEAQDSSRLQEQILRLLAGNEGNWVRVGDPNQAIFESFTTASPQHLLDFIHEEDVQYRELPDSGRCQPSVIALANQLIRWVNGEHPVKEARGALTVPFIKPTNPDDPQPNPPDDPDGIKLIGKKFTPEEEVDAVVNSIARWLPAHVQSTVAVLVPRNLRGADVIEKLKVKKIEFVELLGSTASTRSATGKLNDVISALAEPQSAVKLSNAYLAWSKREEKDTADDQYTRVAGKIRKCSNVETYLSPSGDQDWLSELGDELPAEEKGELVDFRKVAKRWQETTLLPPDQMVLTITHDIFSAPNDLALGHKLSLLLRQASDEHHDWRLPDFSRELREISNNQRRFLGFSEDDSGFNPSDHAGKVVVTTMHKAKGLEWDRVYLMSLNNYDFPSLQANDRYISEKWYIRDRLNLEAETLAQLEAALGTGEFDFYQEGTATQSSRLDYVKERIRLFYVGITRAKKELIVTWNSGRMGDQKQAIPFAALQGWFEGIK